MSVAMHVLLGMAMQIATKTVSTQHWRQTGASLIEVLIAILIISFGMLALAGMLGLSVQLPKLSAYRATAANLAASHVERIRANPEGFANPDNVSGGSYAVALNETSNWSFTAIPVSNSNCSYAGTQCTPTTLAARDINETRSAVRRELPGGDMITKCSTTPCVKTAYGEIWIVWREPSTFTLISSSSDQCPSEATTLYTNPAPRCVYLRFKVE
jgi:type IV pilus assembly protein PilV